MTEMNIYRDKNFPASFFKQLCKEVHEVYNKKKPPKKKVVFKKLTFTGINLSTKIFIEESENKYTNGIINLKIPKGEMICIPFRYSKKYHGNLNSIHYSKAGYNKSQFQKQYQCTLLDNNRLKISIVEDDTSTPIPNTINHIEGVDVNVKHNLLQCSDGFSIDYDRKLVKKIIKQREKFDKIQATKKKRGLSTNYTEKQRLISQKNSRRSTAMVENCLKELFKHCRKEGIDHLVFEDLDKFIGRRKTMNNEFHIKYKKLMSILKLLSIKTWAIRIGKKYGITVSLTNPEYTSQECSHCHHIAKNNRKNQEEFRCKRCGYENNADLNAAINIRDRISSNVLRKYLHEEDEPNKYVPYINNHKEFREAYKQLVYMLNY